MAKLSKETKQRLQQLFQCGQFVIRWGFIPTVLYLAGLVLFEEMFNDTYLLMSYFHHCGSSLAHILRTDLLQLLVSNGEQIQECLSLQY